MCGRFSLAGMLHAVQEEFGIEDMPFEYKQRYNITPSQQIIGIVKNGSSHFEQFRWGLIPRWAKDEKTGYKMINARAESVAEKPTFRNLLKDKRCLIAADGFYEWKKFKDGKKPIYCCLKTKKPFSFAGLYDEWKDPKGNVVKSATIITTKPNDLLKDIHDRMPVIIGKKNRDDWLGKNDADNALKLLKPYPEKEMDAYEVSSMVNSPKNDKRECIEPLN